MSRPNKDPNLVTILVRLPVEMRDQLREASKAEDRTQVTIIRRALRKYLDQPLSWRQ